MRTKIVAGNWKMNKTLQETVALINDLKNTVKPDNSVEVIIAPPYVNLVEAVNLLKDFPVKISAQNMHFADSGAYTGEVSADMLKVIGVDTVIIGHSERRAYFNETDDVLQKKAQKAYEKSLTDIFCVGEKLEEREAGNHFEVVKSQLTNSLFQLPPEAFNKIVIAYEPVWAIGTGQTASPEQAQEMHQFIRETIANKYGIDLANSVRILYGGSVKPGNAAEIFSKPDVDGGLIGGASLKAEDFNAIIEAAKS